MSFFEFWRSQKERAELLKRASELRLHPSQLKRLQGDSAVRAELHNARMASLLPPVGTEVFRRFTPASMDEIQERHEAEEKERQERRKKKVKEADLPKQAAHLEDGKPLPFIYGDPPPELLNTPLEDLDPFYQSQKTFIVLDKGNIIHRFNAESACYLLSPFSRIRTIAIRILLHSLFRLFILVTLLTNCVVVICDPLAWIKSVERVFTAIYTFEVIVKIVSRGFCIRRFTFLRDPWNWLDVLVVIMAFLSEFVDLGKVSVLRTVPRALKVISVYPGMKMTVAAVVQLVKRLAHVLILMAFVLSVLAVIALSLFMGNLKYKCVMWPINTTHTYFPDNETGISAFDFHDYINDPVNQYFHPHEFDAMVCGNYSDATVCPEGYTCFRTNKNPNFGFTSFDSFGWSLLSMFRLMTHDFWENLMQLTAQASGKSHAAVFILLFLPGCFFLVSLILAVAAVASVEQDKAAVAEAKRREEEFMQIQEVMKRREAEEEEKKTSAAVIKSQEQEHPASGESEEGKRSCRRCCVTFLRCNCCGCCRWLRQRLNAFVTNPFFDLGIVTCIILNTIFMAMEHFPMTMEWEEVLSSASLVFTWIFTVEMLLKLVAMDPYGYFQVSWNIFDSIIVVTTLLDLGLMGNWLRWFKVMRVLRLARWWPPLHMFLKITWTTVGALRNLSLVLLIMVFIFTVAGMQLFQRDYIHNVCRIDLSCELPRWHMADLFHTFVLVFRILCGEWIETMWDCMEVSGPATCMIFFIPAVVIGHLLVLKLFLALLLSSSSYVNPVVPKGGRNPHIAINQIKRGVACTGTWILERVWPLLGKKNNIISDQKKIGSTKDNQGENLCLTSVTSDHKVPIAEAEIEFKTPENEEEKKQQDEDSENHRENTPQDCCCCDSCYRRFPFLDLDTSQGIGRAWSNFRRACLSIVQHKVFENFIIVIILLSSAVLVFEDIYLQQRQVLQMILDTAEQVFTYLFLLEMVLKWIAYGFKKYFTCAWCWLDFLILAVSVMSLILGALGYSELGAGVSLRTLRALKPLRVLSRFKGLRVVLKALAVTSPSMFQVLLVSLVVWLVFNIVGVNLFAGKFDYCFNERTEQISSHDDVDNKTQCLELTMANFTEVRWKNRKSNFDNVVAGYVSLLHVVTLSGWLDVMYPALDSREVESQPVFESKIYMFLYFICFIIIARFFTVNYFIRVLINTVDQLRHKFGGKHVFMTEEQQKYSTAMKRLIFTKTQKPVPRPQNKCQALLFDLVTKPSFEVFIVVLICLNMVTLMLETDDQSLEKELILSWLHLIFIVIYLAELLLKLIALRQHYFSDRLNILDFVVVLMSVAGMFFQEVLTRYFISPVTFRVLRLARIFPVLRLARWTRGIQKLLLAFMMSLPALFNICLLLFILMFTFSIFGMLTFAYVKKEILYHEMFNFETFRNSMMVMFAMTMTTGWDGALYPIRNTVPDCDPDFENPGLTVRGNCSSPTGGVIFFASYIVLSILLVVHLYVVVILETFNMEDAEHLSDEDLQMFYKTWRRFDPDASQVIQYSQLSDFCNTLQDPLKIPKPNTIKLIHMDLPLLPGDKVHCVDVLLALTAQVFDDSEGTDALKARMEEKFVTNGSSKVSYEPISSTLRRKQEEVAASVIQRAYRKHALQGRHREETAAEPAGGASGV